MGIPLTVELYSLVLLVSALIALFLASFAWNGERKELARAFSLMQAAVFAWCFIKYFQTRTPDPETQLFFLRLQFAAIAFLPLTAYGFGRAVNGGSSLAAEPRRLALLLVVPALTSVIAWLPGKIFWTELGLDTRPLIAPSSGPWFYVNALYAYLLIALCILNLMSKAWSSRGAIRGWYWHITGALCLPVIPNIVFIVFGIEVSGLDPTPISFAVSGFLIGLSLKHYNLFDTVPYAKSALLSALTGPILTLDSEGFVVGANPAAEALFPGHKPLEGKLFERISGFPSDFFPEDTAVEIDVGSSVYLATAHPIPLRRKRWGGTLLALSDVTERSRALAALTESRESLRRYDFMVNASRDFMSIINRDRVYEAVNDAFCVSYGRCRDDLVGKTVNEVWGEDVARQAIEPALESCFRGETVVLRKSFSFGTGVPPRHLEVNYNPFRGPDGRVSHAVVVTKDIGEYIENQRILAEAREKAEEANRAKSAFFAAMSHEIRTPLNAVIGLTDLALREELSPRLREDLETVRAAGRSLLGIINDILDISKIEAGRLSFESLEFVLVDTVEGILKTMKSQAEAKGLHLELELGFGLPGLVRGDPLRLGQIFLNLVGNAIKFTESGGIRVLLESEPSTDPSRPLGLRASISDTGIGIPEDKREIIFDSFSQADSSVSRRYGGTGLGLSICKKLTTLFGGRIWVESEPGRGSTFSFTAFFSLPDAAEIGAGAAAERAGSAGQASAGEGCCPGLSILLVEDNKVNAMVATRWLEGAGHRVQAAVSGEEALSALKERSFDLILMDVEMPGMDGMEASRRIRAGEAGAERRDIPIIAMTAHADPESRAAALAAGMNDHVAKPVDFTALDRALRKAYMSAGPRSAAPEKTGSPERLAAAEDPPPPPEPTEELARDASGRLLVDTVSPLARLGGDRELYEELAAIFAEEASERKRSLKAEAEAGNWDGLRRAAHSLKGSALTVGAVPLSELASRLEKAAAARGPGPAAGTTAGVAEGKPSEDPLNVLAALIPLYERSVEAARALLPPGYTPPRP